MTNKPMLSVERELLERIARPQLKRRDETVRRRAIAELRALLDKQVNFLTPDCPDCACVQDGRCLCIPSKPADHPQCEECKGWGYHENHYEGGGTECGECSGSGKAPVEQFSADTVVCRRYQLEQHPGQNFYHYDLEPVYGSVPVTVSELITMVESAPVAVVMPERSRLRDLIAEAIGGDTYDCTRVWSAWGVGTMSDDDFVPVVEQDERLYEIADSVLAEVAILNGVKP